MDKFYNSGKWLKGEEMEQDNCPLQYSGSDNGRRGRGKG
jgi:hypothetical protein